MRIEFFSDEKILLIYGDADGAKVLHDRVSALASGGGGVVAVHELPGFESVEGCELFFSVGKTDRAAWRRIPPNRMECSIGPARWADVAGLIEPFCQPSFAPGFQHLDAGFSSEIRLILSRTRAW